MHSDLFRRLFLFEDLDPEAAPAPADNAAPDADPVVDDAADPVDLTAVDDIDALEASLVAEFDGIRAEPATTESNGRLAELADGIEAVRAERVRRDTAAAEVAAEAEALAQRVAVPEPEPAEPEQVAVAAAATVPAVAKKRGLNAHLLAEAARRAPQPNIDSDETERLTIVAALEVPGIVERGGILPDIAALALAAHERARGLSDRSGRVNVASIKRTFDVTLKPHTTAVEVRDLLAKARNPKVLAASGGWCAPSMPLYSFFNIACDDGMVDVPTVGVERGGIEWPVSPSLADFLGDVWHWTETDDQSAVTGAPTKPCVHVPCPETEEERLAADGICVTAGFLQSDAWPELIADHLSKTTTAHGHVINASHIAQMVGDSTAVTSNVPGEGSGVVAPLLAAINTQAADYREKFGMCDDDILEVVLPRWIKAAFQNDLAYRGGVEGFLAVMRPEIVAWFDARNLRAQFVADWQTRGIGQPGAATPITALPSTVQFLLYAAGTFVRGNGARIDLGVIRDSTLNATNDYTAAWTEEATLIAMLGHESRVVTVDIAGCGEVGAADISC